MSKLRSIGNTIIATILNLFLVVPVFAEGSAITPVDAAEKELVESFNQPFIISLLKEGNIERIIGYVATHLLAWPLAVFGVIVAVVSFVLLMKNRMEKSKFTKRLVISSICVVIGVYMTW